MMNNPHSVETEQKSDSISADSMKVEIFDFSFKTKYSFDQQTDFVDPQAEIEIENKAEVEAETHVETDANVEDKKRNDLFHDHELKPQVVPLTAQAQDLPHVLIDELLLEEIKNIPNKLAFKIGDVAAMLDIKQYVLRYWEQEFEILKPKKAHNNQRMYTRKHVENAFLIRKLLYRDKFSIEGARLALKNFKGVVKKEIQKDQEMNSVLQKVDSIQDRIKLFISDVRKAKELFK